MATKKPKSDAKAVTHVSTKRKRPGRHSKSEKSKGQFFFTDGSNK